MGWRNPLKTVCAIDRLKLWKHCYHYVSFPEVVWSPSVTCLALHKDVCMCTAPLYLQTSYWNRLFYIFDKLSLDARCLFNFHANVSNLSQIDIRFITNRWYALEWRSLAMSLFYIFTCSGYPYPHMMYLI